jgi:hypothetical protein
MGAFEHRQAQEIRDCFQRHGIRYLFLGKSGAILLGYPVCHIDDIIASKAATNRQKDRESLPRLRSFREYWPRQRRR